MNAPLAPWARRIVLGCGVLVAVAGGWIIAIMILLWMFLPNPFNDRPFDTAAWHAADPNDPQCPRGMMFDSLKKTLNRTPPNRPEVLQLLGKPDAPPEDTRLTYNLGFWSGMGIDLDTMEIEFDREGRFLRCYRVQH